MLKSSPISDLIAEDKFSHQTPCPSLESKANRLDNELFPFASAGQSEVGVKCAGKLPELVLSC